MVLHQLVVLLGSSPHTRGAHAASLDDAIGTGIIPAYAGSTRYHFHNQLQAWDHPRIRGEHLTVSARAAPMAGSSPHTRGAPVAASAACSSAGIIPAYAGSTSWRSSSRSPTRDHPRIRGEHNQARPLPQRRRGSSPHTRGAHVQLTGSTTFARIIPAYAGSTVNYLQVHLMTLSFFVTIV